MSQSETRPEETTSRHLVREERDASPRPGPGKPFVLIGVVAGIVFLLALVVLFALDEDKPASPAAAGRDQQAQQAYDQKRQTRAEAKAGSLEDEPYVDKGRGTASGITEEWEQQLRRAKNVSPPAEEPSDEEIRRRVDRLSLVEQVMAQRQAAETGGEVPGRYAYNTRENQLNERKYEDDRRERAKEQERQPMFVYSRSYRKAAYFAGEEDHAGPPGRTASLDSAGPAEAPDPPDRTGPADKPPDQRKKGPGTVRYGPLPPIKLAEGEFIDAVLTHRIVSDTEESPVICSVSRDLIDNSGQFVVIPAGTRITGRSQVVNYMGAARLFIKFHRLILPNGLAADFPDSARLAALDATGALGAVSQVNRHWLLQFGAAIFVGVLEGLGAAAQQHTDPYSGQAYMIEDTTDNFEKILNVVMQRYSNIVPTITVGPGYPMKIFLTEDILLSPFARLTERGYARR